MWIRFSSWGKKPRYQSVFELDHQIQLPVGYLIE
jgi:hypothetical protein